MKHLLSTLFFAVLTLSLASSPAFAELPQKVDQFLEENSGRIYTGTLSNGFKLRLAITSTTDDPSKTATTFQIKVWGNLSPARTVNLTTTVEWSDVSDKLARGRISFPVDSERKIWVSFNPKDPNSLISSFGFDRLHRAPTLCQVSMIKLADGERLR